VPVPGASFDDEAYRAAGAEVVGPDDVWSADIIFKINPPNADEVGRLREGQILIGVLAPALDPDLVQALSARGATALAMDAVPRISRAQSMDVLSSMANVAGYRAVIEAPHEYGRMFTGQVTAAGKTAPARVFVVGAGVAGLAAMGAANSMGAIVRAFDVRPEVAEQVESMGAEFVRVEMEQEVSTDGYAKEMTADQQGRRRR
jgi:NAD(P) transhydrogenase subunit alpha